MLHKAWNSKEQMPYCFPRSSIKFQGHTGQNITDFDPNWAFPDYRPVAAFKSLRFALFTNIWFLSFLLETVSYYLVFNNSNLKNAYDCDKFGIFGAKFLTRLSLWNQIFVSVHVSIPGFVSSLKVRNINQIEKYIDDEKDYLL